MASLEGPVAEASLVRRCAAEALGTALLLATVVGSGIMGERLAGGSAALALLANSLATGAGLTVFILLFAPVSGAHLNPIVTLASVVNRGMRAGEAGGYIAAQISGAFAGVAAAHAMFGLAPWALSAHARPGAALIFSEAVATFGLLAVVLGLSRRRPGAVPFAVGAYILAAYWFTASTSFANPAVTLARAFTDTFTGIRLEDAPGFIAGQLAGATAAAILFRWLVPPAGASAR